MQIANKNDFLPLELVTPYYKQWECDTALSPGSLYLKCLEGTGNVQFSNGNVYKGTFLRGLMHGNGSYKWQSGILYEGEFKDNCATGTGTIRWPDGSTYSGQVRNGKKHGSGQYHCAADKSTYKGQWAEGLREGLGTIVMANGSVYEGSFRKGLREGRGTMTYPNGNKYIGEWKGNKKEGQGEMEWQDAHEKYEGSWNDDLPHGEGTYYWYDSKNGSMKTIYKGGWNQGRRSGLGGFLYANGARFEGSFRDNLKEGFSIMTDENGEHRLQVYQHDRLLKSRYTAHEETGICDNPYAKILALCCPEADGLVANYLLRENSLIRNWYKILSQPDSDSFVGVTLESMWRIIRETKLLNDGLSLPRLNRQFSWGSQTRFSKDIPDRKRLQQVSQHPSLLDNTNWDSFDWTLLWCQLSQNPFDWSSFQQTAQCTDLPNTTELDVHKSDTILLFRHFVYYILLVARTPVFGSPKETLRKRLQEVFTALKTAIGTQGRAEQMSQKHAGLRMQSGAVPKECSDEHTVLLCSFTEGKQQLLCKLDKTVSLRQLYGLLCRCGFLKDSHDRMLLLEKVSKTLNPKSLRRESKTMPSSLDKLSSASPQLCRILDHELLDNECDQILYLVLARKIGTVQDRDQFMRFYRQSITLLVGQLLNLKRGRKLRRAVSHLHVYNEKDSAKRDLMLRLQQQERDSLEAKRKEVQLAREVEERQKMKREDYDAAEEDAGSFYD